MNPPADSKRVAYYPGCGMHAVSRDDDLSLRKVCQELGIELVEPSKWVCCGSAPAHTTSRMLSLALPMKNMAEIAKMGFQEVAVPCASCFSRFKTAQYEIRNDRKLADEVADIIEAPIPHEMKVIHPVEIMLKLVKDRPVTPKRDLSKLKVACYYGCLLVRPPKVVEFDECEDPHLIDDLLKAFGISCVDWAMKTDCCGASFSLTKTEVALALVKDIFENAVTMGTDVIAVACPLCHFNLDSRQAMINKTYGMKFDLPVLYFTQLIGLAMGLSPKELGLHMLMVSPKSLLAKVNINGS